MGGRGKQDGEDKQALSEAEQGCEQGGACAGGRAEAPAWSQCPGDPALHMPSGSPGRSWSAGRVEVADSAERQLLHCGAGPDAMRCSHGDICPPTTRPLQSTHQIQ